MVDQLFFFFEMTTKQEDKGKIKNTEVELYVINKVKEYRIAAKMSQRKLCMELRLSPTYVFYAESSKYTAKYNLNQLNELAKIFKCSIADFMPSPYVEADTIEEYMDLHPKVRIRNEKMKKDAEEKGCEKREEKKGKAGRKKP